MKRARPRLEQSAAVVSLLVGQPRAEAAPGSHAPVGIGMHSYGEAWKAAREKQAGAAFSGALSFLEYAHSLGAGGVQVTLRPEESGEAPRIRARAEELGLYFEGQLGLPRADTELERFVLDVKATAAAGANVARTAMLGTRRYETFKSDAEWREFKEGAWRSLTFAEPVLRRHGLKLAVENHKDWLVPELIELLRRLSSEWVGACVDTGNSIALLEDPQEVVEALSPFAFSTHLKDMAVRENDDGFLLSEVPLGTGFLDLARMVGTLRRANPRLRLNLEMITRDPLVIPCLSPGYWATLGEMKAPPLARALARAKRASTQEPLPRTSGLAATQRLGLEDANVRRCLDWSRQHLS